MYIKLHKQATTTLNIRAEIQAAPAGISDSELARQIARNRKLSGDGLT